jgi:RNA recognition motif-containing protein
MLSNESSSTISHHDDGLIKTGDDATAVGGNVNDNYACELFVGDLSFFCTELHIQELFSTVGSVISKRIRQSGDEGHSLMHGFVRMSTPQEAKEAVNTFNGMLFMGRHMR